MQHEAVSDSCGTHTMLLACTPHSPCQSPVPYPWASEGSLLWACDMLSVWLCERRDKTVSAQRTCLFQAPAADSMQSRLP